MLDEELQPTTEVDPQWTGTPDIQDSSLVNGLDESQDNILDSYDKIGKFDLTALKVETIDCGFDILNKNRFITRGQGRVIVVGASTSHGKTAMMMQIGAYVSKEHYVVGHSFEMQSKELETRLLASESDVPMLDIMDGRAKESQVELAREGYLARKLYISNNPSRSLPYVMNSIWRFYKKVGPLGLVIIDYGQQLKPGESKGSRVSEVGDISSGLQQLAQKIKCNIMVGIQLNNEITKRAWETKDPDGLMHYEPKLGDVRESSTIAHDAHFVLMLVRPHVYNKKNNKEEADLFCLKDRQGELWDASIKWDGPKCKFWEEGKDTEGL